MQEFPDGKLNVFISYSRENFDFADQLDESLKLTGFATTLDRHGISGVEEWRKRLGGLIRDADTVVFVLSPMAAAIAHVKSGTIPSASVTRFGPAVHEQYRRRGRNAEAEKWAALSAAVVARQTCPNVYSVRDLTVQPEVPPGSASVPFHPVFARLVANTSKSFACQGMINYYASRMGLSADIVEEKNERRENVNEIDFGNKSHRTVCGTIRFEVPLGLPGYDAKTNFGSWANSIDRLLSSRGATEVENKYYLSLSNYAFEEFIRTLSDIGDQAYNMVQRFLPHGVYLPAPSAENLERIASLFQARIIARFQELAGQQKWAEVKMAHFSDVTQCVSIPGRDWTRRVDFCNV